MRLVEGEDIIDDDYKKILALPDSNAIIGFTGLTSIVVNKRIIEIMDYFLLFSNGREETITETVSMFSDVLSKKLCDYPFGSKNSIYNIAINLCTTQNGTIDRYCYNIFANEVHKYRVPAFLTQKTGISLINIEGGADLINTDNPVKAFRDFTRMVIDMEHLLVRNPKTGGDIQGYVLGKNGRIWKDTEWIQMHSDK